MKTAPWTLTGDQGASFTVACDAGSKVVGGGHDNPAGDALELEDGPTPDGAGWKVFLGNLSSSAAASGTVYAICVK